MGRCKKGIVVWIVMVVLMLCQSSVCFAGSGTDTSNWVTFTKKYIESSSGTYRYIESRTKARTTDSASLRISHVYDNELVERTSSWVKCKVKIRNGSSYTSSTAYSDMVYAYFGETTDIPLYKSARAANTKLYLFGIGNSSDYAAYISGKLIVY